MTTKTGSRAAKVTLPADNQIMITREFDANKTARCARRAGWLLFHRDL